MMKRLLLPLTLSGLLLSSAAMGAETGRYEMYITEGAQPAVYLLDTVTGNSWRQARCNTNGLMNCWQLMQMQPGPAVIRVPVTTNK
jgi:hypothetical protein